MAKHPRQIIRESVAQQLRYKTAARERVFETRMVPWKRTELPAVAVYALEESAQDASLDGDLDRALTLQLDLVETYTESLDDALDALAMEVEAAMGSDPTFGGAAKESRLTGTSIEIAEEGGRVVGVARLTYEISYQTSAAVPE